MISLRFKIEVALLIFLGVVMYFAHHYYNAYLEEKNQKENVEKLFSKGQAEIELYRNHNGQLVAKNEQVELENKTIKQLVKEGNLPWLKNFEGLKSNFKNLETAFQVQSKILDSFRLKLYRVDTFYVDKQGDTTKFEAFSFEKKDKWSDIKVRQISPDSVYLFHQDSISLEGVSYWHRKWFLGKKHEEIEVTSENPHVQIEKILHIKASKKK